MVENNDALMGSTGVPPLLLKVTMKSSGSKPNPSSPAPVLIVQEMHKLNAVIVNARLMRNVLVELIINKYKFFIDFFKEAVKLELELID